MSLSADDLIADIVRAFPDHQPGTRPIHAPGLAATGVFQATAVARSYSSAQHLAGRPVPVTVRFSNGTGQPAVADADPTVVRGMAVKFHLGPTPGGSGTDPTGTEPVCVDMVCVTLPVLFVRTVEDFPEYVRAATPVAVERRSWWRKQLTNLALRAVPDDPPAGVLSAALGLFEFGRRHPEAGPAVVAWGLMAAPESYSTCSYHPVHAFAVTAADGTTRLVRFRWEPVDGIRAAAPGTRGDYLRAELEDRLGRGAVEFVLRMQVGEPGDDPSDPTRAWPISRPRIVMGHLLIRAMAPAQVAEQISFDPTRLVPGVAPSDDPTLAIRGPVYQRSFALRRAHGPGAASPGPPD